LLTIKIVASQNLVPNPSFEDYTNLPTVGEAHFVNIAIPWFAPGGGGGSSDYWHELSYYTTIWGKPRTGLAYAGFYSFRHPNQNYREFIEVKLKESLIKGKKYRVTYYVSLCDMARYAIGNFSAFFSNDSLKNTVSLIMDSILSLTPQIHISNYIIIDTIGWTKISGEFTAQNNEQFMTIGNFDNNANTNYLLVNFGQWHAYYIYDDISVYPCDASVNYADAGNDIIICKGQSVTLGTHDLEQYLYWWSSSDSSLNSTQARPTVKPNTTTTYYLKVKDFKFDESYDTVTVRVIDCKNTGAELILYPNPAYDEITIEFNRIVREETTFELFDILGRKIASYKILTNINKTTIILPEIAAGVYTYRIQDNEKVIMEDKLVIFNY